MNDQEWESILDLLVAATEDLEPGMRKRIGRRICDELSTNPRFAFLRQNIWHRVDLTAEN